MIEFKGVSSGYGKELVLKDLNVSIKEHSITTIIGPNGSGKSTLLKSIFELCDLKKGDIRIGDKSIKELKPKELAQKVCYLSQHHTSGSISVEKMVLHGRFPYISYPRNYTASDYEICKQAMERAGILSLRFKNMSTLSGGEQQKVYLAMAFARKADILLFDEPTTYLDITYQLELLNTMQELKAEGKTILAVLHDLSYALNISDQVIVMNHGKMVAFGTPEEIYLSHILEQIFEVKTKQITDHLGTPYYVFDLCKNHPSKKELSF